MKINPSDNFRIDTESYRSINPEFKKTAFLAAREAGKILERNFRKKQQVFRKKSKKVEWVTRTDLCSEEIIRKIIKEKFSEHDILGEEGGGKIGKGFTWVVDPLDGTSNYLIGLPLFSIALTLLDEKKPILATVFNPISKELYFAEKGKGAFLNGKKISVNSIDSLSKAIIYFNKGKNLVGGLKVLIKIAPHIRTARFHGMAHLEICQVAAGKGEGFFSVKPVYWDMGAGAFIAQEAGASATDFNNKEYSINSPNIVVSNGRIHGKLLKLINK